MKNATSATLRATLTDCSTSTTVVPAARSSSTSGSSCATTTGARPSDSSSISKSFGVDKNAMLSASICC